MVGEEEAVGVDLAAEEAEVEEWEDVVEDHQGVDDNLFIEKQLDCWTLKTFVVKIMCKWKS